MNLTRRNFVTLTAALGAAAALASQPTTALAEQDTAVAAEANDVKHVRTCCRGCGKMECGVWVTVQNGRAIRVEGDESAFQSMGNCCIKSQSSLQAAYHPDRLYHPMKRTNPRGADDPGWVRITWDEAIGTAAEKMRECIDKYGGETVFGMSGTSRMWGMHAYGPIGTLAGSPNMAVPWQVCKGPRQMAGAARSLFQDAWQETVARPLVYTQWGTACELSNYDDSCRTVVDVHDKAEHHILVDPRMTNLGKEADIWCNLRPGTDDALVLAWTKVVIDHDLQDDLFVKKWTNAPFLFVADMEPSGPKRGRFLTGFFDVKTRLLKESDLIEGGEPGRFMVWDNLTDGLKYFDSDTGFWQDETDWEMPTAGRPAQQKHLVPGVSQGWVLDPTPLPNIDPALYGEFDVTLKDGRTVKAVPVWQKYSDYLEDFTPEKAEKITGVPAEIIEKSALTWATRLDPETGYGNGGIHYQLAIEHACNSFNTPGAIGLLIGIAGNYDIPGSSRANTVSEALGMVGAPNGASSQPWPSLEMYEKQLGADDFPFLKWWQFWADDAAVFDTIATGDPYPVKYGWCSTGDFMCMSNSLKKWEAMKNLEFFVVEDLWKTPTAGMADILLPATHWIETNAVRVSQGAAGGRGATVAAVDAPADVKYDGEIIVALYKAMGVPFGTPENPWPTLEESKDESTASFGMTWNEYAEDFQKNGWVDCKIANPSGWGTYRRYETGMLAAKLALPGTSPADLFTPGWTTPTRKMEIWSTIVESFMPEGFSPLPFYVELPLSPQFNEEVAKKYPFTATSGRRIPVYFHSEHRQLPWCREQWPVPRVEINPEDAAELGIQQGDWVWIENDNGKIRQTADLYYGIQKGVVNLEHQWWFPELDQADKGFDLCGANCLVTTGVGYQCAITGASYLRGYGVKIYKATPENSPFGNPCPCDKNGNEIIHSASDPRLKNWLPNYSLREEA